MESVKRQALQYLKMENHLEDWVQEGALAEELLKKVNKLRRSPICLLHFI
jgi:hypothetical protein